MTVDPLMKSILQLSVSVEALAALGAALRLHRSDAEADLRVRARLQDVLHAVDPYPSGQDHLGPSRLTP